jgi:WD40 repeat protein
VLSAAFSPDGKKIITASWDKTARIWDATTGKELQALEGHTSSVFSAAFSPDGKKIVTASGDKTARIWDATTGKD